MSTYTNMASTKEHKFAQAPWRIIREFVGIYGVKMDYSRITHIPVSTIEDVMRKSRIINPFVLATMGQDDKYFRRPKAWKSFLLKQISRGYKNDEFYKVLSSHIPSLQQKQDFKARLQTYKY